MSEPPVPGRRVQDAHGDAWQALGRIHAAHGGGTAELPGIRLMGSGLPHPQWNNGDVDDPAAVDIAAVRQWYVDLGVPWGVRVRAGDRWPHGRLLFGKRLMAVTPARAVAAEPPAGVSVSAAGEAQLDGVLVVDSVAFGSSAEAERPWLAPLLGRPDAVVAAAHFGDRIVGSGYAVVADGLAGRSVYVAGIGVLPEARRRGIGAAVSSWLIDWGLGLGAELAHLHPDTDAAASVYRRLGFTEVEGFDVYVDN
ncbi:MAG TPA: GNAT family N-acetyltransferase [Mycobacteriales bacterium]|nr:GNAT family N-acetyltransferase [Mycobacteriales bacterium]